MTEIQKKIYNDLFCAIKNSGRVSTIPTTLLNFEQSLLLSDLNIEEITPFLVGIAVAKHSYTYWMAQIDNPDSPWKPYVGSDPELIPPWLSADAEAAVSSALYIGATLIIPGLNALTITGTIVSVASASVGNVIWNWAKKIFGWK